MKFDRTRNSARTFIFGVISKLIGIIFPFVIRTLIISELGAEYLGLSSLFTSVLQILNVSELGISSAISFCLYKPIAEDDLDEINGLLALLKKLYKCIGVFILLAGFCVLPFLDKLISGDYPKDINIYLLYVIYLLNSTVSYLGYAYKTILFESYQEGYINQKIQTIVDVVKYIAQITVLVFLKNYYWFAVVLPIASVVVNVITNFVSRKKHPQINAKGKASKSAISVIKKKVVFLMAHSFAATLTNSVDNIVISGSLGLLLIAKYGNYNYIFTAITSFIVIAYRALKPAIGNSIYVDTAEKKKAIFDSLFMAAQWISIWCAICLFCLYQPFIKLWIGEKYLLDSLTVLMIVLYFYGNSIKLFFSSTFIDAMGLWDKTLLRQIVVAILNVILDIALVKQYGVAGIVFASFFATTIVALPLDVIVTCKYAFDQKSSFVFISIIKNFIILLVIGVLTYSTCNIFEFSGVIQLVWNIAICIIMPNLMLFLIYRKSKEMDFIVNKLKHLIAKTEEG